VVEVSRPERQERRRQGKSDTIDAIEAARAAQGRGGLGQAKSRDGNIESRNTETLQTATTVQVPTLFLTTSC
jgi:hypothetical protein